MFIEHWKRTSPWSVKCKSVIQCSVIHGKKLRNSQKTQKLIWLKAWMEKVNSYLYRLRKTIKWVKSNRVEGKKSKCRHKNNYCNMKKLERKRTRVLILGWKISVEGITTYQSWQKLKDKRKKDKKMVRISLNKKTNNRHFKF